MKQNKKHFKGISLLLAVMMFTATLFGCFTTAYAAGAGGVTGWSSADAGWAKTELAHGGDYALSYSGAGGTLSSDGFTLKDGVKYIISAYVKRTAEGSAVMSAGGKRAESEVAGSWEQLSLELTGDGSDTCVQFDVAGDVIIDDVEVIPCDAPAENLVKDGAFSTGASNWHAEGGTAAFAAENGYIRAHNLHDFRYTGGVDVKKNTWYYISADFFANTNGVRPWTYLDMANTEGELTLRVTRSSDSEWQTVAGLWYSGDHSNVPLRLVADYNLDVVNGGLVPFNCTMPLIDNIVFMEVTVGENLISAAKLTAGQNVTVNGDKVTFNGAGSASAAVTLTGNTNYLVSASTARLGSSTGMQGYVKLSVNSNEVVSLSGTMSNQGAAKDASKYAGTLSIDIDREYIGQSWSSGENENAVFTLTATGSGNTVDFDELALIPYSFVGKGENILVNGEMELYDVDITAPEFDKGEAIDLTGGAKYSFMNCDTGRTIALNGEDEFIVEKEKTLNFYSLKTEDGKYIDLTGSKPAVSATKISYLIYPAGYDRYQIVADGNYAVYDNDNGTNDEAQLALIKRTAAPKNMNINTGWYITKSGDKRPLKVLPLGDSITYGVDDDIPASEPRVGYRKTLSESLMDYFGRVVFVGDKKTETGIYIGDGMQTAYETTLADKMLLRHAGRPGWTINGPASSANPGLDAVIGGIVVKYQPDIVCLMIGTNDCGVMSGGNYNDANMTAKINAAKNFVNVINRQLPYNGLVIYAALSECSNGGTKYGGAYMHTIMKDFNSRLEPMIQSISDDGTMVAFVDNYANVHAAANPLGKDGLHLSVNGHNAMAGSYLGVIKAAYDRDSVKKNFKTTFPEGVQVTKVSGANPADPGNSYSFKLTNKENYTEITAVYANGERLYPTNGVYTLKNILEDTNITVTGCEYSPIVPDAPTVTALAVNDSIIVEWEKVEAADGYKLYRKTGEDGVYTEIMTLDTNGQTSYADYDVEAGVTYHYILACTLEGEEGKESYCSATALLKAPATVKAVSQNASTLKVSWAAVEGAEGYRVYRADSANGEYTLIYTAATNKLSVNNLSRVTGKTYYYKVAALDDVKGVLIEGELSAAKAGKAVPGKPKNVKTSSVSATTIKVSWDKVAGAKGYKVYASTTGKDGSFYLSYTTNDPNKTSVNVLKRTTGKTYYFKVRAISSYNGATVSGTLSAAVTGKAIPATPVVTISKASATSIRNKWKAVYGADGYEVYRSLTGKSGTFYLQKRTEYLSYANTALKKGQTYYYKVRAYTLVDGKRVYGNFSTVKSYTL